jgi:uncharacterized membrane protein HdeD (DUF308 family)
MLETLTRYWWVEVVRGLAAVLFGVMALIWPGITLFALVVLFGAYALVDGVFTLIAAFGRRESAVARRDSSRGWLIAQGIAGILLGILTFVWPGITTLALLFVIAGWAIVTGVLEIIAAVRLRREMRREWLLALSGLLSVVFGILLAVWPASGALALVIFIGISAIVFGITLLAFGIRLYMHRHRREERPVTGGHRPATA